MDFESLPAFSVTSSNALPGWTINHGLFISPISTCIQTNCCNLPPDGSEVIIAPSNGYIDPFITSIYPVFSVFGDTVNSVATSLNSQLNTALAGNRFLRLNRSIYGTAGNSIESLTRVFTVTPTMNVIDVAYMIITNGAHNCCESPGFRMTISTSSCPVVFNSTCPSSSNTANSFYLAGTNVISTIPASIVYSKWQIKRFDLNDFIGQTVTLTINASGCIFGGHFGYAYVDARATASMFEVNNKLIPGGTVTIPHCTTSVLIKAPPLYNTYFWTGPNSFTANQPLIQVTASGVYTLSLNAGDPCASAVKTIAVNFLPPPVITSFTSAICPGQNLTLTANGAASYTWTHNNATTATVSVNPFVTTSYTALTLDTNKCQSPAFYTVTVKPTPTLSIVKAPFFCVGDSAKIVSGGATTYQWLDGNGIVSTANKLLFKWPSTPSVKSFTLTGWLPNTCQSSLTFSVFSRPLPIAQMSMTPSQTLCPDSKVNLIASGGNTYVWKGPGDFNAAGQEIMLQVNSGAQAGLYSVFVTDSVGCTASIGQVLYIQSVPSGILKGVFKGCAPLKSKFEFVDSKENIAAISRISWQIGSSTVTSRTFEFDFKTAGDYEINGKLVDANNCQNEQRYQVNVFPKPIANFSYQPINPIAGYDMVEFFDQSEGEQLNRWEWSFINNSKSNRNRSSFFLFENEGLYPVAFTVNNYWGCSDTLVKTVKVVPDISIYVPNAFTPGVDQRNDIFIPVTTGILSLHFSIYDRWGHLLFESSDMQNGWDGTYNNQPCKEGIYNWVLTATDRNKERSERTGSVMLVR